MEVIFEIERSFYGKVDPRRRQERSDSRMVQEDHTKIANCSEQPVYHTFNPDRFVEKLKQY